ncbi:MAG: hypothetical protein ACRCSO_03135 [Sphingomonas sp.]
MAIAEDWSHRAESGGAAVPPKKHYPWENVFSFLMAAIFAGALLTVLWVSEFRRSPDGLLSWKNTSLIAVTISYLNFSFFNVLDWLRRHAR